MVIVWIAGLVVSMAFLIYASATDIPAALRNLDRIKSLIDQIANGLNPGRTIGNPGADEVLAWLDSVPHDHKVTVTSSQDHEGKNWGLWTTYYPTVSGSATAEFGGATSGLSHLSYTANLINTD